MAAIGAYNFPGLPYQGMGAGFHTSVGTILPPGGNVHFVRSTGAADFDPPEITRLIHPTLVSALGPQSDRFSGMVRNSDVFGHLMEMLG